MTSSPAPEEAIRLLAQIAEMHSDQAPDSLVLWCDNARQPETILTLGHARVIAAWNRRAVGEREQRLEEAQIREQEETILALQAEIRGIHDSQWNEIETAPHGVDVLLFSPTDMWGNTTIEVGQASWGWRNSVANNMSYHGYATHWQPLPAAPRAALAGQTEGERNGG